MGIYKWPENKEENHIYLNTKTLTKNKKTKRWTKDIDQIVTDLEPQNLEKIMNRKPNEDLPGLGQYYCVFCDRYFTDNYSQQTHEISKEHKKRVKRTHEVPYTIKDSLKFAGMTV